MMAADRLRYAVRLWLAKRLASFRLHRFEIQKSELHSLVHKRRRHLSWLAIRIGNCFLGIARCSVRILIDSEWIRWETAIDDATRTQFILRNENPTKSNFISGSPTLTRKYLMGDSLHRVLIDRSIEWEDKLKAVTWAFRSLRKLHCHRAKWNDGPMQPISHGDATASNAIVDLASGSAIWIDFDMRHREGLAATDRHADDFRALIFSVASQIPNSMHRELIETILREDWPLDVEQRYAEMLISPWKLPNIFQLAQAPMEWQIARQFIKLQLDLRFVIMENKRAERKLIL